MKYYKLVYDFEILGLVWKDQMHRHNEIIAGGKQEIGVSA